MLTRSIALTGLFVCAAAAPALAEVTTCSDSAGEVSYVLSSYDGGVPPFPGTQIRSLTLVSQGKVLMHVVTRAGDPIPVDSPLHFAFEDESPIGTVEDGDQNIDLYTATFSTVEEGNPLIAPTTVTCLRRYFRIPPP
jgi:hypothetical protein